MRILVAGCAGFLGHHLCKALLREGHRVLGVDDLSTGRAINCREFDGLSRFHWVEMSITATDSLINLMDRVMPDMIINLACPASPPRYQSMPEHTLDTSILGTRNLLNLAVAHNARFIQASTSEVYGDPKITPQHEDYWGNVNPAGPRSCYDEGKRAAETYCHEAEKRCLDVLIFRIFNTYGPNMDPKDGRVVSNFITRAIKGEPLQVYGGGTQTRSFCYVSDLVEGFMKAVRLCEWDDLPLIMNLGNPNEVSIRSLYKEVTRLAAFFDTPPVTTQVLDLPVDDPLQRRPSIELASRHLDWSPKVLLEDGLKRTMEHYADLNKKGLL